MIDYAARRTSARESMAESSVDLLAVSPGENMSYLLGFSPRLDERPCFLLLSPERETLLMPEINAAEARRHTDLAPVTYSDSSGAEQPLRRLLDEMDLPPSPTVALDEKMRADFTLLLLDAASGARPVLATNLLGAMRMRKDPQEIELIQENARIADRAMEVAFSAISAGVSERQVAEAVRGAFAEAGVDRVNFALVASGENGSFPHHRTAERVLQEGDPVVLDIGARKHDYNSDITRMAHLGDPSAHYEEVHGVVEAAVEAALAKVMPGAIAADVDRAARNVISAAGYGEYFVHRTGHGLGLHGHELPYITESNEMPLQEGMVFSIEPGIYIPGEFGVRLEELVVVTSDGPRVFSALPREVHRAQI